MDELQYDYINNAYEPRKEKPPNAAKLLFDQVKAIRLDRRPIKEIAAAYNLSTTAIRNIKQRRSWARLK